MWSWVSRRRWMRACPAGTFAGALDPACLPCPRGTYQPSVGQSACLAPDDGYHAPPYNRTTQLACPAGFTTHEEGWTCVNASTPFTLDENASGLQKDRIDSVSIDSTLIIALASGTHTPLVFFNATTGAFINKTSIPGLEVNGWYSTQVSTTEGHIFITESYYDYVNNDYVGGIAILTHSAQPTEVATLSFTGSNDGISSSFAEGQTAAVQVGDRSIVVIGDPEAATDDTSHSHGSVMVVSVRGDDPSSVFYRKYDGMTYSYMGQNVTIDEHHVYASYRDGITGFFSVQAFTHELVPTAAYGLTHSTTGFSLITSIASNGTVIAVGSPVTEQVVLFSIATLEEIAAISPSYMTINGTQDAEIKLFGQTVAFCGPDVVVSDHRGYGKEFQDSGYLYVYRSVGDGWVLDDRIAGSWYDAFVGATAVACHGSTIVSSQNKPAYDHGTYYIGVQTAALSNCGAGTNGVYPACTPCQPGTFSRFADSICLNASAGFFTNVSNANVMTECAPGYYQPEVGQTSCIAADPGFYVDPSDHSQQLECPPGYFSSDPAAASCTPADPGYYVPPADRTSQVRCRFQDETGQVECKNVTTPGQYTPVSGAWAEPLTCPDEFTGTPDFTGCVADHMDYVVGISGSSVVSMTALTNHTAHLVVTDVSVSLVPTGCALNSTSLQLNCTQPVTSPTFTVTFTAGGESHTTTATLKLFGVTEPPSFISAHVIGQADSTLAYSLGYSVVPAWTDCEITYALSGAPSWATVNETALIMTPDGSTPSSYTATLTATNCVDGSFSRDLTLTYLAVDGSSLIAQSSHNNVVFEPVDGMEVTNVTIAGQSGATVIDEDTGEATYVPIGPTANGTTTMTVTLADGGSMTIEVTVPAIPVEYNVPSEVWFSDTMTARTPAVNGSCAASLEASYLGEMSVTTAAQFWDGTIFCIAEAPLTADMLQSMTFEMYDDNGEHVSSSSDTVCLGFPMTAQASTAKISNVTRYTFELNGVALPSRPNEGRVCPAFPSFVIDAHTDVPVSKDDGIVSVVLLYDSVPVFEGQFIVDTGIPWLTVIVIAVGAAGVIAALCFACVVTSCLPCVALPFGGKASHVLFRRLRTGDRGHMKGPLLDSQASLPTQALVYPQLTPYDSTESTESDDPSFESVSDEFDSHATHYSEVDAGALPTESFGAGTSDGGPVSSQDESC
ncbi:type I secretion target repeat-containing protein [Carpediemonas membranifera]|uniref:Type I secretion target repeat-containing protein n=1 Tax=Carpediemonas membranifera TaxID=201153 RepID=A0A8J6DYH4_9EUKA|nr:type I secretion target repeat-containing protein [Carpediemonas membranifera]|eukprot:KAG9392244.1 type I secretion target repeat-containing protein [Carpediemonas membranifera]